MVLFFLMVISQTYGFELKATRAETALFFRPEYNLNFRFTWDIALFGSLELNELLILNGGIAAGQIRDIAAIDAHGSAEIRFPFLKLVPLSLKAAYIYNGLPAYNTHIHSLLPLAAIEWRYFGVSAGYLFRYTFFSGNPVLFEPILAYRLFVNFFNTDNVFAGISLENYDDFFADNLGFYSIGLYNRFRLTQLISASSELEINISGNVGRITSIYGLTCKCGIIFTW